MESSKWDLTNDTQTGRTLKYQYPPMPTTPPSPSGQHQAFLHIIQRRRCQRLCSDINHLGRQRKRDPISSIFCFASLYMLVRVMSNRLYLFRMYFVCDGSYVEHGLVSFLPNVDRGKHHTTAYRKTECVRGERGVHEMTVESTDLQSCDPLPAAVERRSTPKSERPGT